ncbi:MAG: CRISPR-associated endonuclease Cas2 [bacterium]|nr:CRISPR-associated endonuclease Cas2 [bacterium]
MLVVVCYDVSTVEVAGERRLRRVAKVCEDVGQRVQKSVFECLVEPAQWEYFKARLIETIDLKEDSLRFYFLGSQWKRRVEHIGTNRPWDPEGVLIL